MAITVRQYTPRVDVIGSYAYPPGRGAIRYKQTKIIRSKLLKTGRRGDVRRSTFSGWRRASISASSDAFERNRPRSIHLIRLSRSRIEHSSPDSDVHAKQTEFAVATGGRFTWVPRGRGDPIPTLGHLTRPLRKVRR